MIYQTRPLIVSWNLHSWSHTRFSDFSCPIAVGSSNKQQKHAKPRNWSKQKMKTSRNIVNEEGTFLSPFSWKRNAFRKESGTLVCLKFQAIKEMDVSQVCSIRCQNPLGTSGKHPTEYLHPTGSSPPPKKKTACPICTCLEICHIPSGCLS